jgi:glycosyltransferase involved in cell wall biosynthesis
MDFKNISILVATNHLECIGGTETYTYAILKELSKRNYNVEYFTFRKGFFSEKIENELGINFMSKKRYELILTNHVSCVNHLYKLGFTIQTCHGIFSEIENPSLFANAYVSISQEVQEHLLNKGCASKLIYNGIDTDRFLPKKELNDELKTVLSLSQSIEFNDCLQSACSKLNINLICFNKFKNPVFEIEEEINKADAVFALGRSAYESMACGRPVIVFDKRSYFQPLGDGYIANNLVSSLKNNCSGRFFKLEVTEENLIRELKKYNKNDGKIFRNFALENLKISDAIDSYLNYYENLIENKMIQFKKKNDFYTSFIGKRLAKKTLKTFYKSNYVRWKKEFSNLNSINNI